MNLQDLRNKVKNITDYSPELQTYQDQVDDLINDAFYSIWTAKRWKFSQVQDFIKIYPDLNFGLTGKNANVLNGSRRVTFSGSIPSLLAEVSLGPFSSHDTSKSYGSVGSAYEGEIFEINGREYTILKIVSDTDIRLAEPYRGGNVVDNTTWVVKKRFYDLPEDCLELLNLSQRDVPAPTNGGRPVYGKVSGLSKRREEEINLREDYTANYAECYIDTPPINVPPAEKLKEISQVYSAGATIPPNTYFEICWAFYYLGAKIGPLSEPLLFKSQGLNQGGPSTSIITLQFSTFDDKPIAAQAYASLTDYAANKFEGLRKVLYYNSNFNPATGKRLGIPVWRAITGGSLTGSEGASAAAAPLVVGDELSQVVLQFINSFNGGNPRYVEWDGSIPRIRPYPRINAFDFFNPAVAGELLPKADEEYFRRLEVRYMKKPLRMGLATDTPQMPYEFHQLLVYGVLEDIYNKSGNLELGGIYRKKIEKAITGLEKRYVDSIDTTFIRGSFTIGTDGFPFYDPTSLKLTP